MEIEVHAKNKNPVITLEREITADDIKNVDERDNAILFIFDESKGWTEQGNKLILKVRFKYAEELRGKIEPYLGDALIMSQALTIFKVHKLEVSKGGDTPENEDKFKEEVAEKVRQAIKKINMKAQFSF